MKRPGRLLLTAGCMAVYSLLALVTVQRAAAQSTPGWYDRDHDRYGRDHDRDDYRPRGLFFARRFGYEDGFNEGLHDWRTGHSFRPAHSQSFRHADRGFDGRVVSLHEYKETYRSSYEEGYRRGYNSGGWRR